MEKRWMVPGLILTLMGVSCARSERRDDQRMLESAAARAMPVDVQVSMAPSDGGGWSGLWVTSAADAPAGLHLQLEFLAADGSRLLERSTVLGCVKGPRQQQPAWLPLDPGMEAEARLAISRAVSVRVVRAQAGAGCIQPTLRVEQLKGAL